MTRRQRRELKQLGQLSARTFGGVYGPCECRAEHRDEYLAVQASSSRSASTTEKVVPVQYITTRNRDILEVTL